jgi:hypothetical protein
MRPVPLFNAGARCYALASVQALFALPSMREEMEDHFHLQGSNKLKPYSLRRTARLA